MYKPTEEKKDLFCPQCGARWSELEVMDKIVPMGFECHRCGGLLEREEPNAGDSTGHEKQSRLMSQLEDVLQMLRQIDAEEIPNNDFETAISHAVPVQRDHGVSPSKVTVPINGPNGPPAAVKGLMQASIAPLDVSVTAGSEKTAAEQASEAQRKANIAAQNILPVWHTTSTVTGQSTVGNQKAGDASYHSNDLAKDEEEDGKGNSNLNEELQLKAYYDQMAQEKEKQAREDQEGDESSGEEDDEFEDVGIGQGGDDTPSASSPANVLESRNPLSQEAGKPKDSESGSSAPATNTSTPAAFNGIQDMESAPAAKKVKFESREGEDSGKSGGDSDEDEEAEFEDAL